jgi:cytochrome c biogenesis protein CcmG/thiol:disulfide interchange protein DsbE
VAPPKRPQSSPIPEPLPAPKRNLLWLWVGIAVVVVIAGVVAVVTSGEDEKLTVGSVPTTVEDSSDSTAADTVADTDTDTVAETEPTPGQVAEVWPVTVTGTPLAGLENPSADPAVGTAAPGLSGFTFDGTPMNIDYSKGPTLLVFLAHWCPHCNREIPEILAWRDSGGVPDGLQVIAVTTAVDPSRDNYPPSEWIVDRGWTWPVLADSQASDAAIAMGVSGFPYSIIIGTDGNVLGRISGELGSAYGEWVAATLA